MAWQVWTIMGCHSLTFQGWMGKQHSDPTPIPHKPTAELEALCHQFPEAAGTSEKLTGGRCLWSSGHGLLSVSHS